MAASVVDKIRNMYEFSNAQSLTNWYPTRPATQFICNVPAELGLVTRLQVRNGKVVAQTASGIEMIVPKPRLS